MNDQLKSLKISLHIPPEYHQQPVIFRLASDYNLEVNITSALLGESAGGDGWFNLLLKGTKERQSRSPMVVITSVFIYLYLPIALCKG